MTAKTLSISLTALEALEPCDVAGRRAMFGKHKEMTVVQALRAGATVRDILWVAGRIGRKDLCVRFALACAQRVAHLNTDPRVKAALDAAQAWLDAPTEANRRAARSAAAYASADAAAYAASASAASAAADAAASAAASAYADAASDAASAAASAYADADADAAAASASAYASASDADADAARKMEQAEQRKILVRVFSAESAQ